ncbi:MAG: rhodanese-like domain-containing protein [Thermodesulfobacteriota bacterium]
MVKNILTLLLVACLLAGFNSLASAYSDGVVKECEKLKADAKEKKDMPVSLPGIKEITGDEIMKMIDEKKDLVIMDNRLKADYDKEHIKDAVLLTVDDLITDPKLAEKYSKDSILVNYCNGVKCWRSPAAILLLQELGFKNLYWYRNGLPDWIKKDYPTVEGGK